MSEISLIIPVYNAEDTIERCLDSIIRQTIFDKIEVFLIYDGSTDTTLKKINPYNEKYSNIRLVNVEKSGPAGARNRGLQKVQSPYVGFVDADDYLEPNMYEIMLHEMNEEIDLVCCGRKDVYCNNKMIEKIIKTHESDPKKLSETTAYIWDKLFRKEIIDTFHIQFLENIRYAEDFYFLTIYKLHARKMVVLPEALYFYSIDQKNSITNKHDNRILDIVKCLRELNEYCIRNDIFHAVKNELLICSAGFYVRRLIEFKTYKNVMLQIQFTNDFLQYFRKYFTNWKQVVNHYKTKKNKFCRTNRFLMYVYILIHRMGL